MSVESSSTSATAAMASARGADVIVPGRLDARGWALARQPADVPVAVRPDIDAHHQRQHRLSPLHWRPNHPGTGRTGRWPRLAAVDHHGHVR
jgi:hypothetical protein